jgi:alkanesulfonate monooxygenase SsuD/methylene tetrahydromethanopterin reductase-like flavin-dependent oxidoreductase (luciferase family)
LGLLSLTLLVELDEVHRRIEAYREAIRNPQPAGKFINSKTAVFTVVHCAETDAQARKNSEQAVNWHMEQAFQTNKNFARAVQEGLDPASYEYMIPGGNDDPKKRQYDYLTDRGLVIVGSPQTCISKLKAYEAMGIDHVLCIQQLYRMPHETVMKSIKLLGEHVIPAFI